MNAACRRSLIAPGTPAQVRAEYTASARREQEHLKLRWGSAEGMLNRFRLGLDVIDWTPVRRWIDIGCGTGRFFEEAERAGHRFDQLAGVDITPALLEIARSRTSSSPVTWIEASLDALPPELTGADLVTAVGLLQRCGCELGAAVLHLARPLRAGGQLFLTTKNLEWEAFDAGRLEPDDSHSWFAPDDLTDALAGAGLHVQRMAGFLPRENTIVERRAAHTIFILAEKRS